MLQRSACEARALLRHLLCPGNSGSQTRRRALADCRLLVMVTHNLIGALPETLVRPKFCPQPLHPEQIRLFKILSANEVLECRIQNFDLASCPPFQSLSYCWGQKGNARNLRFDDADYAVTEHLFEGLLSIYHTLPSSEWLWIDQICINQADGEEKAQQVALMGQIYARATRTIVWLGVDRHKSALAMEHAEGIAALIRGHDFNAEFANTSPTDLGFPHEDDQVWPAFQHLFDRDYFKRLWVIQELILSRDLVFLCGRHAVSYEDIIALSRAHERHANLVPDGVYKLGILQGLSKAFYCLRCDVMAHIDTARRDESDAARAMAANIITPIEFSRKQQCTEPVDRVFAILGLLDGEVRSRIKISYTPETRSQYWTVYIRLFRIILIRLRDGGFFLTTIVTGRRGPHPAMPSWCPDLTLPGDPARPHLRAVSAGTLPPEATWHPRRPTIAPTRDPSCLRILGSAVDTITHLVPLSCPPPPLRFDALTPHDAGAVKAAVAECFRLAESTRTGPGDSAWTTQAIARCLVGNTASYSDEPYPAETLEADFREFLDCLTHVVEEQLQSGEGLDPRSVPAGAARFAPAYFHFARGRAMFVTGAGRLGLCSAEAGVGDEVAVYFNCPYPVVQRRVGGREVAVEGADPRMVRTLLGLCYVDGLMGGEIFEQKDFGRDGYSEFLVV